MGPLSPSKVVAPSQQLLVMDLEAAGLWSGKGVPELPGAVLAPDDDPVELVDLELVGSDATKAGLLLDRSSHPLFLYDVPKNAVEATKARLASLCEEHQLRASLQQTRERVSHYRRVALQCESGDASRGIEVHGYWTALATGLPSNRQLELVGERRTAPSEFAGRWQHLTLGISNAPTVRLVHHGQVSCDSGMLLFADVDALGRWQHREPIDGLADVVLTGFAAAYMASVVRAPPLGPPDTFGWCDLGIEEALLRAAELEEMRRRKSWELEIDLRPHSHRQRLLDQFRSGQNAAQLHLAGATFIGVATGWEEGLFDVYSCRDGRGAVVGYRIVLGTARALEAARRAAAVTPKVTGLAVISRRAYEQGIGVFYRERPHTPDDSGWRLFRGHEDVSFLDDTANVRLVSVRRLIELNPELEGLLDAPEGAAYERIDGTFKRMDRDTE